MKDYYVYIYYDSISGVPYYVGKGKDQRITSHLREATKKNGKRSPLVDKLRSLIKSGETIKYEKVAYKLDEITAYSIEENLIKTYGRRADAGSLLNLALGGRGACGILAHNKGKKMPLDQKTKLFDGLKKYEQKHGPPKLGCKGLAFWDNPKSNLKMWTNADQCYPYWKLGLNDRTLSRIFPEISITCFRSLIKFFEQGDPFLDYDWVSFKSKNHKEKLKEIPFNINSKTCLNPEVFEKALEIKNYIYSGKEPKEIAVILNQKVSSVRGLCDKIKNGYEPLRDIQYVFAKSRTEQLTED